MLGVSSTRCHLKMWSLGMPCYGDMRTAGKGRGYWNYFNKCNRTVSSQTLLLVGVLKACASVVALEEGWYVHHKIIQSVLESDVFVGTGLVDMYANCGSIEDAWKVFHKMPSQDVVTWNAILGGCSMHGHGREALKHFEWMCGEGV